MSHKTRTIHLEVLHELWWKCQSEESIELGLVHLHPISIFLFGIILHDPILTSQHDVNVGCVLPGFQILNQAVFLSTRFNLQNPNFFAFRLNRAYLIEKRHYSVQCLIVQILSYFHMYIFAMTLILRVAKVVRSQKDSLHKIWWNPLI